MSSDYTRNLPPLPDGDDYTNGLYILATLANGAVYSSDHFEAVVNTVRVLRAKPDLRRQLLNTGADEGSRP